MNAVESLVESLKERKVSHIFGVPGGDCSLDVIEAAARADIRYVLCRTENAAGIAASVTAELTGSIGVVMTTRGPGIASGVNAAAYASLDRAPLLFLADNYDDDLDYVSHQRFDQAAILRPLLRGEGRMDGSEQSPDIDALLDKAFRAPQGPVYLEITGKGVRAPAPARKQPEKPAKATPPDEAAIKQAGSMLARAKRPVMIVGFQACETNAARGFRDLAEKWRVPVFTTYRAKGVAADGDALTIGHYTGGVAEYEAISQADLIVLFGFDAIEFPPGKWRYEVPVIEVTAHPFDRHLVMPAVSVVGDLAASADRLSPFCGHTEWNRTALEASKAGIRARGDASGEGPISPQMVVDAARKAAPANARITLDAGAHMLPVLHSWECDEPRQTLLSRGLATMGFAVPAALASALAQPDRPVIAFTGDGGLMMCSGELGTAIQCGCRPIVVVFNDSTLTLIGAKQRRRQLPNDGVDFSPTNFASIAAGYGLDHYRVEDAGDLDKTFAAAFSADRAVLIDVVVNPEAYHEQLISLRG